MNMITAVARITPEFVRELGLNVQVHTAAAERYLKGSQVYQEDKLLAALQLAGIAGRGADRDLLRTPQVQFLLEKTLEIFRELPQSHLKMWLVELRDYDSCYAIERDFVIHDRIARSVASERLKREFFAVLQQAFPNDREVAAVGRDLKLL